ncbi:MAG: hypothetical protein IKR46_01440 [Clostridia bacterium]|nr:hypothetical protein [Clostridia bacterium]
MDIAFFTENMSEGGAQRVISVLANYLCNRGNDVKIVLLDNITDIAYRLDEKIDVVFDWRKGKKALLRIRTLLYKVKVRLCRKKADIFEEKLKFQIEADNLAGYL